MTHWPFTRGILKNTHAPPPPPNPHHSIMLYILRHTHTLVVYKSHNFNRKREREVLTQAAAMGVLLITLRTSLNTANVSCRPVLGDVSVCTYVILDATYPATFTDNISSGIQGDKRRYYIKQAVLSASHTYKLVQGNIHVHRHRHVQGHKH